MVYRRMGQNKDWIWRLLYLRSALSYSPGGKHLVCFQQRAAGRILRGFNQGVLNSSAPDVPQPQIQLSSIQDTFPRPGKSGCSTPSLTTEALPQVKLGLHSPGLVSIGWRPPAQWGTGDRSQLARSHTEGQKRETSTQSSAGLLLYYKWVAPYIPIHADFYSFREIGMMR